MTRCTSFKGFMTISLNPLRHSVLVQKAYFLFAKTVTQRENTEEEKKGERMGERQEKWNKKKRLNF